jgi:DNA modification methylase
MTDLKYGDCYEIIPTLPDNSIDLVITDPPYDFCGQVHGGGMFSAKNKERYGRKREVAMLQELETLDSVKFIPSRLLDLLKPKMKKFYGYFFCNKSLVAEYIKWADEHKYSYDILTLEKLNPIPAHSTHHVSNLEYIILIRNKGTYFQGSGLNPDDYKKTFVTNCQKRIHPAEKPVEFLERFVRTSCPENGVILDPFMGSGSTGIACLNNKRDFIGIEKNEGYFNLASERIKARQDEINGVGTLCFDRNT